MEKMTAPEKLRKWLNDGGRKVGWLAKSIPANRSTVHQWLNGNQVPKLLYRKALQEVTDGAIKVEDWGK